MPLVSSRLLHFCCLAILVVGSVRAIGAEKPDPFAEGVRKTEALSPADEQKSFHLPPGFVIELVAAEPEIFKPMNLAFDARGRLWVTDSTEYPYAAKPDAKPRDTIRVIEDTNRDGVFDKVTTFADGLNIPIGIYPYQDGAIAYSIPNIVHFRDTDGDGRADERKVLYGPFDYTRDTHGMNNAFRRTFDGWIYACHGFNNDSAVKGGDGHEVKMNSGNTYRFRLDGGRIEQFTWGQVNPFGMTVDDLGHLFTADCHSAPIYALYRGGYYPSFGKPHDGLGFVPPVMTHGHGSTAICGVAVVTGADFPAEFQGNLLVGNVMTSRINRDQVEYAGSTIKAKEMPDFLSTDDPWFRPVDLQFGPDGALYVADFYNRIIGHYEVPLEHPGRDRHRGRIWRVRYVGTGDQPARPRVNRDLTKASVEELIAVLGDKSLTARLLATNQIVDRFGVKAEQAAANAFHESKDPAVRAHALWVLQRLDALHAKDIVRAAKDEHPLVRTHLMRALAERPAWSAGYQSWWPGHRRLAVRGLEDADAVVRRCAADALGRHPAYANVQPLLDALSKTPKEDVHLRHVLRMALRDQFRLAEVFASFAAATPDEAAERAVADVAVGVASAPSAEFLLAHLEKREVERESLRTALVHVARHIVSDRVDEAIKISRSKFSGPVDERYEVFDAIRAGLRTRGKASTQALAAWARDLAAELIETARASQTEWVNLPFSDSGGADNPWGIVTKKTFGSDDESRFLTSLAKGEQRTAILRSREFDIPASLSFYLAGHVGAPAGSPSVRNYVRLVDAQTGEVLERSAPPRNDVPQFVHWVLDSVAGRKGVVEIVDGDERGSFAWIAAGRFEPPVVAVPDVEPSVTAKRLITAAGLIGDFKFKAMKAELTTLLQSEMSDLSVRAACANAVLALAPNEAIGSLVPLLERASTPGTIRTEICSRVARGDSAEFDGFLATVMKSIPAAAQTLLADRLASTAKGTGLLLALIEKGAASPRLLQQKSIEEKLSLAKNPDVEKKVKELTAGLPSLREDIDRLIAERSRAFRPGRTLADQGAVVFDKKCANCHRIGVKGALVGPQLDGIGNRGVDRLLEDMLDPNRNVDVAFRTTTYALTNGQIVTGLFRRQEGDVSIVADNTGKELPIKKEDIEVQSTSRGSLMPENLIEQITPAELNALLAYLLTQRATGEERPITGTVKEGK